MASLKAVVCVVTGGSRGIGKGIAIGLGELGATVYVTGRTLKPSSSSIGGSLEETAAEVNALGGNAIPVVVDHSDETQVTEFFERVRREQNGRLDLLVNNAYSAVNFLKSHLNQTYFELEDLKPGEVWDVVNNVGLRNHYICSTIATRLMLDYQRQAVEEKRQTRPGLIVNVSSMGGRCYLFNVAYGVGKAAMDRMAQDMARELKSRSANVYTISLWPGLVRTEELLAAGRESQGSGRVIEHITDRDFSESPELSGRVVAALIGESAEQLKSRSGQITLVSDVALQYSIKEHDGRAPPHNRSLRYLLRMINFPMARFIPGFIRLPKCVFMWLIS